MRSLNWALAAVAAAALAPEVASAQADASAAGRQLYEAYQCWQCHGYEGQGGAELRIAPTVYPFEAFTRLVRHTNEMPAYSPNALTEDNLRLIWEYLRSRPEPPAADDIPALRDL